VVALRRWFIALLSFCFFGAAWAQSACQVEYRGTHGQKSGYVVVPGRSVENLSAVCSWGNSVYPLAAGAPAYSLVGEGATSVCGRWNGSTWEQSGIGVTVQKWYLKPDGTATQTDPGNICQAPNSCTSKTGVVGVLSWTEGYTRTPDEGDRSAVGPIMSPPASGEVCDSGCAVSLQTSGPGVQPYVSQSPTANGLYRRSVDYPSLGLGRECTMGTADAGAKKDIPPPDCPGSVGDLGNGKPVCVGTAAKPITPTPLGSAPGATPIAGNPPAGAKPPSGEGSGTGSAGRTPSTGNGGPAGGPAGAATGGKGGGAGGTASGSGAGSSGTGDEPHKPCGGPGEPTCNVKVDEKGVPSGVGTTYETANAKMDETKGKNDEQLAKASGTADKGFLEPVRSMLWSPPIAACEPTELPPAFNGLKIDACGVVDGGRALMGFLWAAGGLFLCLGMVKRSI